MSLDGLLDNLRRLRAEGVTAPASVPDTNSPAPKQPAKSKLDKSAEVKRGSVAQSATAPAPTPAPSLVSTGGPALWASLMDCLGPFVKGNFAEAHLDSVESGVLSIGFPPGQENAMELANNPKTLKALKAKMAELGQDVREVRLVKADTPANWATLALVRQENPAPQSSQVLEAQNETPKPKPPEGPVNMDEFKNDPLIKKALDVFKGHIVDVRT